MSKKYYIYKMYDNDNNLLYIGKTHNLYARMNAHFSTETLKKQPWKQEVYKVEVIELYNQYDIDIVEIYLIGKEKPKYNLDKVYENTSPSFDILYKIKNKFIINNPLNIELKDEDIQKKITSSKEVYDLYNLSEQEKEIIISNLNIYNKTHIKNPKDKNTLSLNWMNNEENLKRLKIDTYSFFKNKVKTKSKFNRWTTYEGYGDSLKSDGYTKGLVYKGESLEKFNDCKSYAYLRNDFPSDLEKQIKDIDVDFYSIHYLAKVVKYITVDLNHELNLYVPSRRVRDLLCEWLNIDKIK